MFGIGFGEFAIIFVVLIIAVGPEKLPTLMKTVGKTIRGLRQASRDIRSAVGIDEMMREDFNLYAPPPARKPEPPAGEPLSRDASESNAAPSSGMPSAVTAPPQSAAVPPQPAAPTPPKHAPVAQAQGVATGHEATGPKATEPPAAGGDTGHSKPGQGEG